VDFHEIRYTCDAIDEDLDMITFNPTASTILKWLRFKFVWNGLYALLKNGMRLFSIVGIFGYITHQI
jgi:hypothetical protein